MILRKERNRLLASAAFAVVSLAETLLAAPQTASAQFVCGGSKTGAEPQTGGGAVATNPGDVACGNGSVATGNGNQAATALGSQAIAIGNSATAIGDDVTAKGDGALAVGGQVDKFVTNAAGPGTTALGIAA